MIDISLDRDLDLRCLKKGIPGVTGEYGAVLAHSGAVCLEEQKHPQAVELIVKGAYSKTFKLHRPRVSAKMRRCYSDLDRAAELGAYGVAFLLILRLTEFTIMSQSRKGTGFDYWLGHKEDVLFQNKARLEVSGLRKGNPSRIKSRVKAKIEQTKKSDETALRAYVVVVEFATPSSEVLIRD